MVSGRRELPPFILLNLVPSYYDKQNAKNQIASWESLKVTCSAWINQLTRTHLTECNTNRCLQCECNWESFKRSFRL